MNSEELNRRIRQICDNNSEYEAFGGKCIPYIGWFWRDVDFDADECLIGRFPSEEMYDTAPEQNGFMENNKWGYGYVKVEGEQWQNIKRLLIIAVQDPSEENLRAANEAIQEPTEYEIEPYDWSK